MKAPQGWLFPLNSCKARHRATILLREQVVPDWHHVFCSSQYDFFSFLAKEMRHFDFNINSNIQTVAKEATLIQVVKIDKMTANVADHQLVGVKVLLLHCLNGRNCTHVCGLQHPPEYFQPHDVTPPTLHPSWRQGNSNLWARLAVDAIPAGGIHTLQFQLGSDPLPPPSLIPSLARLPPSVRPSLHLHFLYLPLPWLRPH